MATKDVRLLIFDRDNYRCPHCGHRANSVQHRINRQAGGSKHRDNPANLIAFCWDGNNAMESDALKAADGRRYGWKLESWEDSRTQPYYDMIDQCWYMLDDNYGKTMHFPEGSQ